MRRTAPLLCLLVLLLVLVAVPSGAAGATFNTEQALRHRVHTPTPTVRPTSTAVGTPTATATPGSMRIGFDVNGPTDQDLAALNASGTAGVISNFATPLDTSQDRLGLLNIRILRHTDGCPDHFGYACSSPSTSELGAFAAAHPGQTYELGNEVGTPGQDGQNGVVAWVKLGYTTIKQTDSTATVLGPGILNFDSAFYDSLGGSYSAIAFHLYPSNLCLSASWLNQVKSTIDAATNYAAAHGKPAYMTEMSDKPGCSGSSSNRTYYISQAKAYLANKGVVAMVFFLERYSSYYPSTGYLVNVDGSPTDEGKGLMN